MAVVCPACHHVNPPQTLVCTNCHSVISLVGAGKTSVIGPISTRIGTSTLQRARVSQTAALRQERQQQIAELAEDQIAIFVDRSDKPHVVEWATDIIFGRPSPEYVGPELQFDLAPFQGYEKGVSRKHAALRRKDGMYLLEDLGSSNGTSLNEERLAPYIQKLVQSGDRIRLGSLVIEVYFHSIHSSEQNDDTEPKATKPLYETE